MSEKLRQKRGRLLGALTRVRRRAFVLVDSIGSRTELGKLLSELDIALQALEEVNEKYIECLASPEDIEQAKNYFKDAENQHQEASEKIEKYLLDRKNDPPSETSTAQSKISKSKTSSTASSHRLAEVNAKVKRLEASQLQQRLEQERKEQELQRARRLQEARDAQEVAELQAQLTAQAADDLNWERRDDFAETSETVATRGNVDVQATHLPPPAPVHHPNAGAFDRQNIHSLPRLTLPVHD